MDKMAFFVRKNSKIIFEKTNVEKSRRFFHLVDKMWTRKA